MRVDKLAKQLRAQNREQRPNGKLAGTRMRQQIIELDRKIKAQVQALEKGIEPGLVCERIAELRDEEEALENTSGGIGAERPEAEDEELTEYLARIPDLNMALPEAAPAIKRQVFESATDRLRQGSAPRRKGRIPPEIAERMAALPYEELIAVFRESTVQLWNAGVGLRESRTKRLTRPE